ncbi:endo-1,3-alpha-glucanase family glycosylhydrolase [Microbacterium arborescens]|uniref:endo-1,3-alpha-glucanase family glycosylhydrolase n=1 Tax=Microbacterium arborescens TaxID=33883 RepID=UPI003C74F328
MKPVNQDPRTIRRRRSSQAVVATLSALALMLAGASSAQASGDVAPQATVARTVTVTVAPSDVATVSSRTPKTVLKTQPLSATSTQDRSYARFTLPADVDTTKPVSASLSMTVRYTTATAAGVDVYAERGAWSSSTLTYANRPSEAGARLAQSSSTARVGSALTLPLGDVAQVAAKGQLSVRLMYRQKHVSTTFFRTGDKAPSLKLTYTRKPAAAPAPTTPPSAPAPPSQPAPPSTVDTSRKVFAHYFPPYPVSIDNKPAESDYYTRNYLSPDGEGGKHAEYGGLLRDRPLAVPPSGSSSWKLDNLRREVTQAKSAGIDGFTVNIMSVGGSNWEATKNLFVAAERQGGFAVVPMIDASASVANSDPATVADRLAELYRSKAAFRVGDRMLLSSFAAEKKSVDWWSRIIDRLKRVHGVPVTFQAVFLNASDANMSAFRGIADGYGNWGVRTEWHTANGPDYAARAAALGKTWMAPVSVQDYRPRAGVFAESGNTDNLRASWKRAIDTGAQYVQLVTWNDYSESTQFAPSADHGDTFLDISRPYLDWFHSGTQPRVTQDQAFLVHRTQFTGARPTLGHLLAAPTLGGTSGSPTDEVEAVVYLTAPATLTVTVGGTTTRFDAPAGRSVYTVPLREGAVSASIDRSGKRIVSLSSPYRVVGSPRVQDLSYYGVSSLG